MHTRPPLCKPRVRLQVFPLFFLLPCVLLFFLLYLRPLGQIIVNSLWLDEELSFAWYQEILNSPFLQQSILNSLRLALGSTFLGLVLALPACHALQHAPESVRQRMLLLTSLAGNFTGVPLAFAFIILLGLNGCLTLLCREMGLPLQFDLYSGSGLLLIYSYFQIPLAILFLYPACARRTEEREAAQMLGASRLQYWWHIGLPLLAPAILGTGTILCAHALGAYATAYALTTGTYNLATIRISSLVAGDVQLEPGLASALAIILLLLLLLISAANRFLIRKSHAYN